MEKYDLTNKNELVKVIKELVKSPYGQTGLFAANPLIPVIMRFGKMILDKVFSTETLNLQKDTAELLIRKGKEEEVDEMEITVNNRRGFMLNIPDERIKIDTMVGADEKMIVKVKYKKS